MPRVLEHKNVIISFGGGDSSFSCPINIDFVPDEVIVKGITRWNGAGAEWLLILKTDLTNEQFLGFYNESTNVSSTSDAVFTLKKPIRGTYTFQTLEVLSGVNQYALKVVNGDVVIHLDFVKYS